MEDWGLIFFKPIHIFLRLLTSNRCNHEGCDQSQQVANLLVTAHDQWDWSHPRDGPRCRSTDKSLLCLLALVKCRYWSASSID